MPIKYRENIKLVPPVGKNAAANRAYTGSLAPQDINGFMAMVMSLSLSFSRVLVAIMAGTLHPKPTNIGINAFPGRPIALMSLSITKAALAIYPESSKIERHRNINPIGGIKVATVWMPAPTPLASIVIIHAGKWKLLSKWDRPSTNTVPQKISKKINKTSSNINSKHKGKIHCK